MNFLAVHAFRCWWRERKAHAETKAAYDNLVLAHAKALAELASPCRDCERYQDERDSEALRADAMEKTIFWLEQSMGIRR